MNQTLKYFSAFSGIGGAEVGIKSIMPYAKCIGFSETDRYAIAIYKKHFKNHQNYGDIRKINWETVPDFDLLIGGSPCQDLSVAGKRAGLDGERSGLFKNYIKALKIKKPQYCIWENVKGALSSNAGWDFAEVIYQMDKSGYDCEWDILNSKNYGVPQHRERLFVIGYFRANRQGTKQILPIKRGNSKINEFSRQKKISSTILGVNIICFNAERGLRDKDLNKKDGGSGMLSRADSLSYCLDAGIPHIIAQPKLRKIGNIDKKGHNSIWGRVYCPKGVSATINANGGGLGAKTGLYAVPVFNTVVIRKLTPKECERLQGFQDNWTKFGVSGELISDTQRYKVCGNAITTTVFAAIIEKLKPSLIDKKTEKKILIPRVVKFSGGRSSAMMLLRLLDKDQLKIWRGDCVLFCNTSAEHKATYAFVQRIKHLVEHKYQIPFFMIEFTTYEIKNSRGYVRRSSYKLVNEYPYSNNNNPNGYKHKGEVFLEYLSYTGSLPNQFQRNCTINLKIMTNNLFLADYWGSKDYIEAFGHGGISQISDEDIIKKHRKYRGELPDEDIIDKKAYLKTCHTLREQQKFKDFTQVKLNINNQYLQDFIKQHDKIKLLGKNGLKFISYLGIRHDEKYRIDRIRQRIKDTKINKNSHHKRTQPFNEIIKAPLVLSKITQDKVIEFWQQSENSKFDLVLPFNGLYSNCVFCFLKGKTKKLLLAHQLQNEQPDTPSSIKWWTDIEQTFSRKVIKSSNNQYTHIGFGGVAKKYMYQSIQEDIDNNDKTLDELIADAQRYNDNWTMACSCTD